MIAPSIPMSKEPPVDAFDYLKSVKEKLDYAYTVECRQRLEYQDLHFQSLLEDVIGSIEALLQYEDYDPTDEIAAMNAEGGPVTMSELHDRSIAQRRELRGGIMERRL